MKIPLKYNPQGIENNSASVGPDSNPVANRRQVIVWAKEGIIHFTHKYMYACVYMYICVYVYM